MGKWQMFGVKRRRRRRSEIRRGANAINYETTSTWPSFSITPVLRFWQTRGARIISIVILAILGWSLYKLFTTRIFFVYDAEIKGNMAISAREIYLASEVDNQSIFWIHPDKVAQKIRALPNIKSALVKVALPARLTIEVTERRPELLWQTGDTVWWIDQEGTVVPPKTNIDGMLRIIDDDRQPLEVGYQIDPMLVEGAQTLRLLAPDVSVIRHTRAQGLIVATPEGWPIYLGDGSQMRAKLIVLSAILPVLRAEETPPLYIDLGNPLRPVYKTLPVTQVKQTGQRGPGPPLPRRPGEPQPSRP
jgi:cell division protein FtsQ